MPDHRRSHSRATRHSMPLEFETEPFALWMPDPDEPVAVASFGDAANLAFDLLELPATRELLVLLDERRVITAVVVDPPPPVGLFIGRCDIPGLEVPFCQTMSIVLVDRVVEGPASADDRSGYMSLRRFHVLQGLQLLDVILVDGERVRSLAIACDPDPIWFEPFEPIEPAA
ncbi:hypothetical protein BH10ACT3_BH10ACT3_23570 [soil metagenome]